MKAREFISEAWSQKYKSSINCSHPKGFSQRAHCAGKKKHNESREMEMVCEDCGMCQTHGNLNEIKKGEKDSNGYTRCWPGKHADGTKTGKNGGQVRNCVPNESIEESEGKRCRQCGMINCKCPGDSCKCKPIAGWIPGKGFKKAIDEAANAAQRAATAIAMKKAGKKPKGIAEDDDAVAAFVARGGEIQQLKPQRGPKRSGVSLASKHIGSGSGRGTTKGKVSGLGANTGKSGKPVVTAEQGVTEGTDDPAKDALVQALMGHSVDDPRELWVDLKEIGRKFKTPVSKQIRMALPSLSPDDAYELWDTALEIAGVTQDELDNMTDDMDDSRDVWDGNLRGVAEGICSLAEAHAIFDDFEQAMAARGLNEDAFDTITDEQIIRETAAWRRSAGKSKKGGLNAKGVASYRREHPGSHLQMAVTTKPSKLKPGSKAAKRRKSFCARMSGVDGPMKKPNGKPTRKALALRKWNC